MTARMPQMRMLQVLMHQVASDCVSVPEVPLRDTGETDKIGAGCMSAPPDGRQTPRKQETLAPETDGIPCEILGERELAELSVHLQESPERFEAICDLLMDLYRTERSAQAFSLLFQINRPRFERRIRSLLGRRSHAALVDDVLSEVFLAIWLYPDRFDVDRENAFRNWSHTIIRHKVYRALKPERFESLETEELEQRAVAVDETDPAGMAVAREEVSTLSEHYVVLLLMVDSLLQSETTERERLVLRMVDIEGCDSAETAREIGVKLGNLRMILCRGRRKIANALSKANGCHRQATTCRGEVDPDMASRRRARRAA